MPGDPTCPSGTECSITKCPNIDSGERRFLRLNGNDGGARGFTVKGFYFGIDLARKRNTLQDMIFERHCDNAVTNRNTGRGNRIIDTVITDGCDKCAQDAKGPAIAGNCSGSECYHNSYIRVNFEGCKTPVRFSSTATNGTFLIEGGRHSSNANVECKGSIFGAPGLVVDIDGLEVTNCETGLFMANGTYNITNSNIHHNQQRGFLLNPAQQGEVFVSSSNIVDNGDEASTQPLGGAVVMGSGVGMNLGDSAASGGNCIFGNHRSDGSIVEISNNVGNLDVPAQYVWWNREGAKPSNEDLENTAPNATIDTSNPLGDNSGCQ